MTMLELAGYYTGARLQHLEDKMVDQLLGLSEVHIDREYRFISYIQK